jgi:hypothetical protein
MLERDMRYIQYHKHEITLANIIPAVVSKILWFDDI